MPPQGRTDVEPNALLATSPVDSAFDVRPPLSRPDLLKRKSFLHEISQPTGPLQLYILSLLLAFGFGSIIGVVPSIMMDRYAHLDHGLESQLSCSDFDYADQPKACADASADAQNAVAVEHFISNFFTFIGGSWMGSMSDEYGRKGVLMIGISISVLSPLSLVLLQIIPEMSPNWYYGAGALTGLVSWITICLSAISDVIPNEWRAPSFGLFLVTFYVGISVGPLAAVLLGNFNVTVLSLVLAVAGLLFLIFFFPETLPPSVAEEAKRVREEKTYGLSQVQRFMWNLYRPFWELSILNRSNLFRILSALAFFSGLTSSGNDTLLIYYAEEHLGLTNADVAAIFIMVGVLGIFASSVLLKVLNDQFGEKVVVQISLLMGFIHNLCYGFATSKVGIYVGEAFSSFVGMSFPAISSIKSINVAESEQGRIQGALWSLQSLASALGPVLMRFVYHFTRNGALFGPGSMFIVFSVLYVFGMICTCFLPNEATSKGKQAKYATLP